MSSASLERIARLVVCALNEHIFSDGARLVVEYAMSGDECCWLEMLGAYLVASDRGAGLCMYMRRTGRMVAEAEFGLDPDEPGPRHFGFRTHFDHRGGGGAHYFSIAKASKVARKRCEICDEPALGGIGTVQSCSGRQVLYLCKSCWADPRAIAWIGDYASPAEIEYNVRAFFFNCWAFQQDFGCSGALSKVGNCKCGLVRCHVVL